VTKNYSYSRKYTQMAGVAILAFAISTLTSAYWKIGGLTLAECNPFNGVVPIGLAALRTVGLLQHLLGVLGFFWHLLCIMACYG